MDVRQIVKDANIAKRAIARCTVQQKNDLLLEIVNQINSRQETILKANMKDIDNAQQSGLRESMIDRLKLTEERVSSMIEGIKQVIVLDDPCNRSFESIKLKSGIVCTKKVVPFGVLLMIYESRPNVTVDAAVLGLKSGNALILRGGKESLQTNIELVRCIQYALTKKGLPGTVVQLVDSTDRMILKDLIRMRNSIDLVIPRGGTSLIQFIVENSSVPVIETGSGVCHVYVDKDADFQKAKKVIINAKVQRPSVCNAIETVLIDENVPTEFILDLTQKLSDYKVKIRGDEQLHRIIPWVEKASGDDWGTEYNDLILSIRMVSGISEALAHIEKYGTKHSECIISENPHVIYEFFSEVDAAAVYSNASTRFTDGFEFGLGAEIGISTQKMHVRGPMGLEALVTYKYVLEGHGEIRC